MEQKTTMPPLYDHESTNAHFNVPALDFAAFNVTLVNDDAVTEVLTLTNHKLTQP
jgi:hypothetical protein